jgi:hypothetical protein
MFLNINYQREQVRGVIIIIICIKIRSKKQLEFFGANKELRSFNLVAIKKENIL